VIETMRSVPRHLFVRPEDVPMAYDDHPLPIGMDQTISQPYIVALMTESLELGQKDRVLEIGTGCGYQAAVLSMLAKSVCSIEVVASLGHSAAKRLEDLGYGNVEVRIGDGHEGWPEALPFDAIVVTAAPEQVPPTLLDQLADGGRMSIPVGAGFQELFLMRRKGERIVEKKIVNVRFVPMIHGR
jgi:protein-L-isoaspartate(D-aspartate) O-methyltransferase